MMLEDLVSGGFSTVFCAPYGLASSFFNPYFMPNMLAYMKNKMQKTTGNYMANFAGIAGYGIGLYIISGDLIERPTNPISYIPIATNILGGFMLRCSNHDKD
jgi:hypothetical protein